MIRHFVVEVAFPVDTERDAAAVRDSVQRLMDVARPDGCLLVGAPLVDVEELPEDTLEDALRRAWSLRDERPTL